VCAAGLSADRCNASPCTCCCIAAIAFKDKDGVSIGSADVPCYWFLPKVSVKGPTGQEEFALQQPSCCGGLCVNPMAEGLCNCKLPIYIYPPGKGAAGEEIGKIIKLWRGLGTEAFTDATSFKIEFPKDIDAPAKQRLLGSTMFINMMFFESGNE